MVDVDAIFPAWLPVAALITVRTATKALGVSFFGPLTGVSLKKGFLTGLGLMPMSALALMLIQQVSEWNPQIAQQTTSVLLPAVVILQLDRRPGAGVRVAVERGNEDRAMKDANLEFGKSESLTMGVELELQLIDRRTGDLTRGASDLIALVGRQPFPGNITPEITESMLEVSTSIQHAFDPLRSQLIAIRDALVVGCRPTRPRDCRRRNPSLPALVRPADL